MSDPDLNDMIVFTRVVEAGGFSAAAKLMQLPTSTVSRRVSRLEDRLGVRLLQRTTRTLSLTDAGRVYYERGIRIATELADADRAVIEMKAAPRGKLRVTAPGDFAAASELITGFLAAYPEVQIEVDLTNRHVNLVDEGYDVALRAGELTDSSLIAHRLFDGEFRMVASPTYLGARGTPVAVEDLREHDCIVFGASLVHASWDLVGPRGPIKIPIKGRLAVNHLFAARDAAKAGLGIALLPGAMCCPEIRAGHLQLVLPEASPKPTALWVVYPSRRHVLPAVRVFVDFARRHFEGYGSELRALAAGESSPSARR